MRDRVKYGLARQRYQQSEKGRATRRAWEERTGYKNSAQRRLKMRRYQLKWVVKHLYGITIEQYDQMFREQQGCCAICSVAGTAKRRLGIDHDHDTGRVRGLLCQPCNALLGRFEKHLDKALRYLKHVEDREERAAV